MKKRLNIWRDASGAIAVEAALLFPFLLLLLMGTLDASYMILQNHRMETQLSSAGSYLAKSRAPQNFESQARFLAATGQTLAGGGAIISNWNSSDIQISYRTVNNESVQGGGRTFRGGDHIRIVQLSSEIPYQGLGFLRSIMGERVKLVARYEERIVGAGT